MLLLPGAGTLARARGWCRCEYFVFSLWSEMMRAEEVQLYQITRGGFLVQFPKVEVGGRVLMPSGGALSNPADKASLE